MSGFNGIEYDAESNVVMIGAGLRWDAVYSQLEQYNVTVVGGRVLDVGVGGLILGGKLYNPCSPFLVIVPHSI